MSAPKPGFPPVRVHRPPSSIWPPPMPSVSMPEPPSVEPMAALVAAAVDQVTSSPPASPRFDWRAALVGGAVVAALDLIARLAL